MTIGERISELRRTASLSQEYVAEKLGVSRQAVSKWERGSSCPDISILDEIACALDVSVSTLLGVK